MRETMKNEGVLPTLDQAMLRRVCGTYATGVAIVSVTCADGTPCGLTVNSFASVSLDPPLVLWSLRSASPSLQHFDGDGPFAINILAEHQDELALKFAKPADDKFDGVRLEPGASGAPIIGGSVAHLECRAHSRMEAGDHIVFVWEVVAVSQPADAQGSDAPLAFFGGRFHGLAPLNEMRAN